MPQLTYKEKLDECLAELETKASNGTFIFSDWEKSFLKGASEQFAVKDSLSLKQIRIVEKCWAKLADEDEEQEEQQEKARTGIDWNARNPNRYRDDFSD